MISKVRQTKLQIIDYTTLLSIVGLLAMGATFQDPLLIDKLRHLIPGSIIVFLFLKLILSTSLAKDNFDKTIIRIFWTCFFYYIIYIAFSSIYSKETDLTGHLYYIKSLYEGELPSPAASWQTYHPPLFHILAVPFLALGKVLELTQPYEMIRYLSLISYMVFMFYSALLFKLMINKKTYEYIALAILALWPIGMIFAAKINNDILIYSTTIAGIYYLVNWFMNNNNNYLWIAASIGLLSIIAKTSGLLFCSLIFLCVVFKILRKELNISSIFKVPTTLIVITFVIALTALSLNFGRTQHHNMSNEENKNFIAGNLKKTSEGSWGAGFIKDDNISYYSTLNLELFFNEPYVMLFSYEHEERKYFWNVFIKSSILGSGNFYYPTFLKIINSTYLALLLYILFSYIVIGFKSRSYLTIAMLPLAVMPVIALSAMMYMRSIFHLTGYSQSRFAHYIIPILIIFLMKALAYHKQEHNKVLHNIGLGLTYSLGIMFFVFMVGQYRIG